MAASITGDRRWFVAKLVKFLGSTDVVEAGEDGLAAGTLQEALQDLATRVQALEDAA